MAIISKNEVVLINGKKFLRIIKYSKGMFSIDLPEDMVNDMLLSEEDNSIEHLTEKGVIDIWDKKMRDWKENQTITTKIIAFSSNFKGSLYTEEHIQNVYKGKYKPAYAGGEYWHTGTVFMEGSQYDSVKSLGMDIVWGVYEKITIKDKVRYKFLSGRPMDLESRTKGVIEIEWSPDRENWFLVLDEAFANMIAKVHEHLGRLTSESLEQLVDSGKKFLTQ